MQTVDAMAGEYMALPDGRVVKVNPACGSSDRRLAHLDYDRPADGRRVRYAACRVHRTVEAVTA